MSTTENTTPMPNFLPLDSSTDKLRAVKGELARWDTLLDELQAETIGALEQLGATWDEAYELLTPSLLGPEWDRESVRAAIDAELDRRKGTPLPGLEGDS